MAQLRTGYSHLNVQNKLHQNDTWSGIEPCQLISTVRRVAYGRIASKGSPQACVRTQTTRWEAQHKKEKTMKMKVMEMPKYPEIEIVGKTIDSITGSIDRLPISRSLITTDSVDKTLIVVDGDETVIKHVDAVDKEKATELFVELVGCKRSLASFKFFGGYIGADDRNAGVKVLFTEETEKIDRLVSCAERMCNVNPECDGQWKIVDKDGTRWFIRTIATKLTSNGKIER